MCRTKLTPPMAKSSTQRPATVFEVIQYNNTVNSTNESSSTNTASNTIITDAMLRTMICAAANRGRNAVR